MSATRYSCPECEYVGDRLDYLNRHAEPVHGRTFDRDEVTTLTTCPECGDDYEQVSRHWAYSNECDYPSFEDEHLEIIRGFLLGDGHLDRQNPDKPTMEVSGTNTRFLKNMTERLSVFTGSVRLHRTGEEQKTQALASGLEGASESGAFSDLYRFNVHRHPDLATEFDGWYSDESQWIPSDETVTPTSLKVWFCSDGYSEASYACIAAPNLLSRDESAVLGLFDGTGLDPQVTDETFLTFKRDDGMGEFFDYMGDPYPGMAYKWPADWTGLDE